MTDKNSPSRFRMSLLATCVFAFVNRPALSNEQDQQSPEYVGQPQTQPPTDQQVQGQPPQSQPPPQVVYVIRPGAVAPQQQGQTDTLANLRQMPRYLRPIEGQEPPFGYVETTKKRKGVIIGGSALFGAVYIVCASFSSLNKYLLIPIAGPMIAAWQYENGNESGSKDPELSIRFLGTIGTIAQVTGVTMFVVGMAAEKKVWMRQDLAGISVQLFPIAMGRGEPGLGLTGSF